MDWGRIIGLVKIVRKLFGVEMRESGNRGGLGAK